MTTLPNSSYLDATSYGYTSATTVTAAYGLTAENPAPNTAQIVLGIQIARNTDPTSLLAESWAAREATISADNANGTIDTMYGASATAYSQLLTDLSAAGITASSGIEPASSGYDSSAADQTVWLSLNPTQFQALFGVPLLQGTTPGGYSMLYWDGNLAPTIPDTITGIILHDDPLPIIQGSGTAVPLASGPQGVGNDSSTQDSLYPNQIAANYHFPLAGSSLTTAAVGLLEPNVGDNVPSGGTLQADIDAYRAAAGVTGSGAIVEGSIEAAPPGTTNGERSLDVGVVAAADPNSTIVTDAGVGTNVDVALQEAVFDPNNKVSVLSTSFTDAARQTPGSVFYNANRSLVIDAVLHNISVFYAAGDGGSGAEKATGIPLVNEDSASPYAVVVSGTSNTTVKQAATDPTLSGSSSSIYNLALSGDVATLEALTTAGMLVKPVAGATTKLTESVWNGYYYNSGTQTLNPSYSGNTSGTGGVDTTQAEPGYQTAYGISIAGLLAQNGITVAAYAAPDNTGRGFPDVSAQAGGNEYYKTPGADGTGTALETGTSAAAPLWAALTAQIDTIFANEGLPTTGYFNDLLYQAAAIDPAAFNDVQLGNDKSTYTLGGSVTDGESGGSLTPTGLGYTAGVGYDFPTGLGTPDGVLLARALTQIAEAQTFNLNATPVSDSTGLTSQAAQLLIVQPTLVTGFSGSLTAAGITYTPSTIGSGLGWSARLAQQTLQSYFDPNLATALDGQAQASSQQISVAAGQSLAVAIGGVSATPTGQADTAAYGFLTDVAGSSSVTLARPLAVAETYNGANNTTAVVRIRQDSPDTDVLSFFKVDSLTGSIGGILPGQAGYTALIAGRLVQTGSGTTSITAPGDGQFLQTTLTGINNGDIIAFSLQDKTAGAMIYGIASQNADGANHLWSYGSDTWGFDDASSGFDGDYNDVVFQMDFTSEAGTGLLVNDAAPACYVAGTLIATPGGECPVERLTIGQHVLTAEGASRPIRWIGRRSYSGAFIAQNPDVLPVVFHAGSLGGGLPRRDLWVSPLHAMFVDGALIPARLLANGVSIQQARRIDQVEYVHVELDSHDILLAEGAPAESFADDHSRGIFHNAAEYRMLYPDAPLAPARYCAPRIEAGEALAAAYRRLAALACPVPDAGLLRGYLDTAERGQVTGWARDMAAPGERVRLLVAVDGAILGEVVADSARADLQAVGEGDGRHAFSFTIPGGLSPDRRHVVDVQRASDGCPLRNSPMVIEPAPLALPIAAAPARPLAGVIDRFDRDRIVGWAWQPGADVPIALQVLDNGAPLVRILANQDRADLRHQQIGDGRHGFDIIVPGGLSPLTRHVLEIRRESDGAALPGTPVVIEPADSFDAALEAAVERAVASLTMEPEQDRALSFLLAQTERLLQRRAETAGGLSDRLALQQFRRRWGPDADGKGDAPADPGRRALVIDSRLPEHGRDAGSEAVLSHLRALQALGYAVSVAAADDLAGSSAALAAAGVSCLGLPAYASVEDILRRQAGCFDLVYLHRAPVASRYLQLARQHMPRARVVYSVADLHHVRLARQADVENRPELTAASRGVRLIECTAAWSADVVITHSTEEAAELRRAVPGASVHVVPWALPIVPAQGGKRRPSFAARQGLAFIGNAAHSPNADAAQWLVEVIMPLVWQIDPAIECLLLGSTLPAGVRALARPGVTVLGHVPDLRTVFHRVRLTVAPLRYGAGVKGKVLTSLAARTPCVMTSVAAAGLTLSPRLRALIGQDAAELASLIVRLHQDERLNRAAARAGVDLMRRDFSETSVIASLGAAIDGHRARPGCNPVDAVTALRKVGSA